MNMPILPSEELMCYIDFDDWYLAHILRRDMDLGISRRID